MPGRKTFLGRHLMLKREYGESVLSGRKKATIRLGEVRPKYSEVIIHSGGRPIAKVRITGIDVKKIKDLTLEDALLDGFNSVEELLEALRRTYGDIGPEDTVTIIKFELVKRLDEAETEDPYLGLEPADIARIALRYLGDQLTEEDKRILKSLTETNSIRETAYRLYGSPTNRIKVRKALRKSIRLLLERGVIRVRGNITLKASERQS